jgi:hypothetical protein
MRSRSAMAENPLAASLVTEDVAQQFARLGVRKVLKREVVPLLNRVGPVGVDAEALGVGDDQDRRVFQRHRVELQLPIGEVEVGAVLLVLPAEMPALPDVGEARAAVELGDTLLERVAVGVCGLVRRRLAEHATQVDEMLLRRLPLGAVGAGPLVDEFGWCHRTSKISGAAARRQSVSPIPPISVRLAELIRGFTRSTLAC